MFHAVESFRLAHDFPAFASTDTLLRQRILRESDRALGLLTLLRPDPGL